MPVARPVAASAVFQRDGAAGLRWRARAFSPCRRPRLAGPGETLLIEELEAGG
ncbi:MAG: hypothetical protein AB8I80_03410 [Anaerolineae bacterium]